MKKPPNGMTRISIIGENGMFLDAQINTHIAAEIIKLLAEPKPGEVQYLRTDTAVRIK